MQRPPLPLKQPTKFSRTPEQKDSQFETPPKEITAFSHPLSAQLPDKNNNFANSSSFEGFDKYFSEKKDEAEFFKSKLAISEMTISQLRSTKAKLMTEYEERTSEYRIEINRLKTALNEKNCEIDVLTTKIEKYEEVFKENSTLQEKILGSEFTLKNINTELLQNKAQIIDLESENNLLKSQKKNIENELKDLQAYDKNLHLQLSKKNEQIETLKHYANKLEYKFKDIDRMKILEKNIVLMGSEIERLQKVLAKKNLENEVLKTKLFETHKVLKQVKHYEKTISSLALENEKLKTQCLSANVENNNENNNVKDPQQVLLSEIDRMNHLFRNENQNLENINKEYQRVMKENLGFLEKMRNYENEMNQMKMTLKGKDREIDELRLSRKLGDINHLEMTLEKKPIFENTNTSRKHSSD